MKRALTIIALACLGIMTGLQASASAYQDSKDDEQGTVIQFAGEQYIRVTTPQQFLHSLICGKNILVAHQTTLNLTPVLEDEEWWRSNSYNFKWFDNYENPQELTGVNLVSENVFDGRQLDIVGYYDIKIVGEGNSRILVEPRYAFCLNFVNCKNILLRNLTIGHTEDGECAGGVISVKGGSGISLLDCNLYGCGTYGLELKNTSDFSMAVSGIHDCTEGIMTLENVDNASFDRCNFFRNGPFTLIISRDADISFEGCRFYANNPQSILFDVDRDFTLKNNHILHPTGNLGTVDFEQMTSNNRFNPDPYMVEELDYFIGAGNGIEKLLVVYDGAKPTIVDFINATLIGDEEGNCSFWEQEWTQYLRTKKHAKNTTYIIDERNGYALIEEEYDDGKVIYHDFCFWNLPDGKHKLFARNTGILNRGKPIETECTGAFFYLYDTDENVLIHLGTDSYILGERPANCHNIAYKLPRVGKDITYIDADGNRGTLKWNGNGFGQNEIPKD